MPFGDEFPTFAVDENLRKGHVLGQDRSGEDPDEKRKSIAERHERDPS
jgi:hypothetical protein